MYTKCHLIARERERDRRQCIDKTDKTTRLSANIIRNVQIEGFPFALQSTHIIWELFQTITDGTIS